MVAEHTHLFHTSGAVDIFEDFQQVLRSQGEWDATVRIKKPHERQYEPSPTLELSWNYRLGNYPAGWWWHFNSIQCSVSEHDEQRRFFFPDNTYPNSRGWLADIDPIDITKRVASIVSDPWLYQQNRSVREFTPPLIGIVRGARYAPIPYYRQP